MDEFVKKCQKMKEHMYLDNLDDDYKIDLDRVVKDVYSNFISNFKVIIAQVEWMEALNNMHDIRSLINILKAEYNFLNTFFRGMLKWCIEEGGMLNTHLVDNLEGIESYFVNSAKSLIYYKAESSDNIDGSVGLLYSYLLDKNVRSMVERTAKAYFVVINQTSIPCTYFMVGEESVVEYIDQVVKNFDDFNGCEEEVMTMRKRLCFLRNFLRFTKGWINPENLQELLICVETLVDKMACFSYFVYYKNGEKELYNQIKTKTLKWEMHTVVHKASLLKLDSSPPLSDEILMGYVDDVQQNLIELLEDESAIVLIAPEKNQFKVLHEELGFLRLLIINYLPKDNAEREKLFDVRLHVEVVARNIGSFIYSSFGNEVKGNSPKEITLLELSDLLEKVKFIKTRVTDTIFLVNSNRLGRRFPQTDRLGFLNFLLENLKERITKSKYDLIMDWKDDGFQIIHDDLDMFRSFLQKITDINSTVDDDDELENLSNRISNASYEADYLINLFVTGACPVLFRSIGISDFTEQLKLIKADVLEIMEKKSIHGNKINIVLSKDPESHYVASQELVPTTDVVIGFEVEIKLLKERLVCGPGQRDIVSIIGMPGLGKTTLAKKMYEDPLIVSYFQIRAWCCVSQEYNKRELLLSILSFIVELNDMIRKMSAEVLSVMLHKELTGRRYLIVVDDIWKIDAWEDLQVSFPKNNIGSRVMLTSRYKGIGIQAKYHSDPLEVRFLTDHESWDLLKAKVFLDKHYCPVELLHVGEKIAKKCKGLPLAVVVVGGLLAKSEKELGFWKQVAGNLGSHIAGDSQRQWVEVLDLTYKLLPSYLKPLFLYLGAFPEDQEISTENLIWLWIAEGFVQKTESRSLEVQAEKHLLDLIDRSLIMVAEKRSNGRVKTCRVHDLLHDFCLGTAKKEFFLQQIYVYDISPDPPIVCQWRLSMCLKRTDDSVSSPWVAPPLHSFLFFNKNKKLPLWNEAIKSVFCVSKLLRVLHVEGTIIYQDLCSDLMMIIQLRYISIRAAWSSIPSSIVTLRNLETLIVKGLRGEITVPSVIWSMVKLRHLHINDRANFEYDGPPESSSKLENLETLSTPALSNGEEKKLIRKSPNLRKLKCIFIDAWDSSKNKYQFPNFESHDKLESLKVLYHGRDRCSGQFSLPPSLKKLTLTKFRMQWNEILSFQQLPNLEVLKLGFGAVDGELWDTGHGDFPKLEFLKLESLNIKEWIASPANFPCLKTLVIERCKRLRKVPDSLGEFNSLEKIELLWCSRSAAKSAKQIQEDQMNAGNDLLMVDVYPRDLDL